MQALYTKRCGRGAHAGEKQLATRVQCLKNSLFPPEAHREEICLAFTPFAAGTARHPCNSANSKSLSNPPRASRPHTPQKSSRHFLPPYRSSAIAERCGRSGTHGENHSV